MLSPCQFEKLNCSQHFFSTDADGKSASARTPDNKLKQIASADQITRGNVPILNTGSVQFLNSALSWSLHPCALQGCIGKRLAKPVHWPQFLAFK
jgi:hypothetical protein